MRRTSASRPLTAPALGIRALVVILLSLLCTTTARTGIALVQTASAQASFVSSSNVAFSSPNTPGNAIIVFVRASSATQTVTVSDSAANSYVEAVGQAQTTDLSQTHIFYARNINGGANSVTASFSGTNNHPFLAIYEYSGLSATNPLDQTAHAQGAGTVVSCGPTASTSAANELVFAAVGLPASSTAQISAGNGYTILQVDEYPSGTSPAATESQLMSASGSFAGVFTLSQWANWSALVATFAAATAPQPLTVTTSTLPAGTVNSGYSATLMAGGGITPYTWSVISGALPAGLTLDPNTGLISGIPTVAATGTFTAQALDSSSPTAQTASRTLSISVNPAPAPAPGLVSISIAPANASIPLGTSQKFTATGLFSDGTTASLSSVVWASANTAVATIDASGLAVGKAQGSAAITAASGGMSSGSNLVVTAPAVVSIAVTPANPTATPGTSVQFTAMATLSDGSSRDFTSTATWNSSTTSVARINSSGLASAIAVGSSTISAQLSGILGATALTVSTAAVHHYEYVFPDGSMYVYDLDNNFSLIKQVSLPQAQAIRGAAVSIPAHTLYLSYGADGPGVTASGTGSMLAYDLLTDKILWTVNYTTGIDSMAITPDGKTIYLPIGELDLRTIWNVVDATTGALTGTISAGSQPHNTVVSLDGTRVYMGPRGSTYLYVASTQTNAVISRIGPLTNVVRPFTINGKQTLAFTTASHFLGFQVSDLTTGQVLYTVPIAGFTIPSTFTLSAPSHGISLSPDEKELWVMDAANSYVHVFDVSGLPGSPPVQVANLPATRPMAGIQDPCSYGCDRDGWLRHTLDGRFVLVGDSGDIFSTATRKSVINLSPLYNTRVFVEIDWQNGVPVSTTTRHGMGYVTR